MCTGIFCHNRLSRYWNRFSLILDRNYFSILHWKDKSYFNIQNYPLKYYFYFPQGLYQDQSSPKHIPYLIILTERISYDKQQQDAGVNIEWFSLSANMWHWPVVVHTTESQLRRDDVEVNHSVHRDGDWVSRQDLITIKALSRLVEQLDWTVGGR